VEAYRDLLLDSAVWRAGQPGERGNRITTIDTKWPLHPADLVRKLARLNEHDKAPLIDAVEQGVLQVRIRQKPQRDGGYRMRQRRALHVLDCRPQR
jgi:hypothetical protein